MSHLEVFSPLRFARLSFTLEALEPTPLAGFLGPTLRGLLGRALMDVATAGSGRPAFAGPNLYFDLFEPPEPAPGEQDAPPPYVLLPPAPPASRLAPGETLSFGLTLFGDAAERIPSLLWALYRYGLNQGLSRERRRYLLESVYALTPDGDLRIFSGRGGPAPERWDPAWSWTGEQYLQRRLRALNAAPPVIEFNLLTPLELREDKRPVEHLTFAHLFRSLMRNVSAHMRHHSCSALDVDFRGLKDAAMDVRCLKDATEWLTLEHESSRQQRKIPLTCRFGHLRFTGDLEPFLPWLELGTVTNVGRSRTHGFGVMDWGW